MKKIRILVQRFGKGAKWNQGNVLTVGRNVSESGAERLLDAGEAEEVETAETSTSSSRRGKSAK